MVYDFRNCNKNATLINYTRLVDDRLGERLALVLLFFTRKKNDKDLHFFFYEPDGARKTIVVNDRYSHAFIARWLSSTIRTNDNTVEQSLDVFVCVYIKL
jgi:hypothetical protein